MDSHHFSSETNSIFVIQESSTEEDIKHEFVEVCADNAVINLEEGDDVVNSSTSLHNDHNYGNMNETTGVTVKNDHNACDNNPVPKQNSLDDSGEINVTVTIHDNLVCSIKEGKPNFAGTPDSNPNGAPVSEDCCRDGKESEPTAITSSNISAKESVNSENLTKQIEIMSDTPRKNFKPISITSVKSLKITKPENFNSDKLFVDPIFCDQDLKNRSLRRSKAWKHFKRLNSQELECNFCKRKISGQSGSSNLLKHLRSQHENEVYVERKVNNDHNNEKNRTVSSVDHGNVYYESAENNKAKKISKIWKYFSKSKLGKVKCKICFKIIPYRKSNSLLVRHLRLKHLYIHNCIMKRSSKFDKTYGKNNSTGSLITSSSSKSDVKNNSTELDQNLDNSVECEGSNLLSSSNKFIGLNNEKKTRRLSESWKYFTKLQPDKIKCNICDGTLKYIEGVSSNLTRHLKVRHKNIYSKNNNQGARNVCVQPDRESRQNKKFFIDSKNLNAIQTAGGDDYDDDKNVTKIRKYFSKFNSGQVKCNVCQVILTHTPGMTFNLKCHIILKHKNIFEKIVKAIYVEENENVKIGDNLEIEYKKIKLNWKYFTKMKSGKLKCNLCTEMPSFYCSISESLLHLRLKHNITLDSDEEQSVVSFIELHDQEPYDDKIRDADDSAVKDFEETDQKESLGILKTDRTWKFFSKIYRDKVIEVKCNLCEDVFSYTRGITLNLSDHLNTVHKDESFENSFMHANTVGDLKNRESYNYPEINSAEHSNEKPHTSHIAKRVFCKKSKAWDYFTVTEHSKAKCVICMNVLTFSPRSSSNLSRHLKRMHGDVFNLKNRESTSDHYIKQQKMEFQCGSVEENDNRTLLDVKSIYEFLKEDPKLKHSIKFESDTIKCNFCLNTFLCQDFNSYVHELQEHMQINHAEWQVACLENIDVHKPTYREPTDPVSSNYNELEAIANEIQSYSVSKENVSQENDNENESAKISNDDLNNSQNDIYKNVWKYFTKLTSQNVRCNFCCALLLFRNNKKWNLYRHLRLKHKSKLHDDDAFSCNRRSEIRKLETTDNTCQQKKGPEPQSKKDSPQKNIVNSDLSRSLCSKDTTTDDSSFTEEEEQQKSKTNVNPTFTPRTGRTWSHFTKVEMGKATCNVCHKSIHYMGTGLEVLNKHLSKCYLDESVTDKKLTPENPSSKLSGTDDQRLKLRASNTYTRSSRVTGGNLSINKDDEKSCSLQEKSSSLSFSISTSKSDNNSVSSSYEEDKNDLDYFNNESDVDSEKYESNFVNKQNYKEKESVNNSKSVSENSLKKKENYVCPYFSNVRDGYAKCHLCLLRIPYKDKTVNLVKHLRRIHSVISVCNPTEEQTPKFSENKKEKSQLMAAVNLAPNKSVKSKNQICFTKLGKKTAKCNFCSKIISHKNGDVRKLSHHLLQMHCSEIFSYNNVMLKHVKIFEKSEDITIRTNDLRSANLDQLKSEKDSCDQSDMPNKKRSVTWLYYKKLSNHSAQCNICKKALSYKGGSIYNLTRHLFIKHNIKLKRCAAMNKHKTSFPGVKTVPKIFNFYKKKNSTLSFYTKINRFFVKCKLCYKHFIYKGININRLINHLWSSHIAKLIDFHYGPSGSNRHSIETNIQKEINSLSPMENYIKNTAEVIYQSMSQNIKKNETRRRVSNTWKYYTKKSNEGSKAKCNLCSKYFSFKNGNVSNLTRHLLRNHGLKVKKNCYNVVEDEKESNSDHKGSDNLNSEDTCLKEGFLSNKEKNLSKDISKSDVHLGKNSEIWKYMKVNNGDVECNACEEKIAFQDGKVSESNLRNHLFLKHRIKFSSSVNSLSSGKKVKNTFFLNDHFLNKNKILKSSLARMRCKLCNRHLIIQKSKPKNLIKHLSIHEKELSNEENISIKKLLNSKCNYNKSDDDDGSVNDSNNSVNVKSSLNEIIIKHFKNISLLKNKCKVCNKFVSSKIYCTHHITNDLSITYGVKRNRSLRNGVFAENSDRRFDRKYVKLFTQKYWTNFSSIKMNHFMNVNSYENKCGSCNFSLENRGYCNHSLNQWLNEKQLEESEKPSGSDGYKIKDELEIITDALTDGENKIIIITDDGAPSIMNYEGSNKNGTESDDVAYHVIDMDNENNDNIQVVIYNFDPEENEKSIDQEAGGAKIEELKYSAGSNKTCDKALEEQVKVILQELNNANVFSNQVQRKGKCAVSIEEKPSAVEKLSINQQSEVLSEKEIVSEEKPVKHILEKLGNENKFEGQSVTVSATISEDFIDQQMSDHSSEIPVSTLEQSESVNSTQKIDESSDKTIGGNPSEESSGLPKGIDDSSYESACVKCNDLSKNELKTDQSKVTELEVEVVPNENNSNSENIFENINKSNVDEADVSIEESAAEFNNTDTISYKNDDIEINSGMLLQNLNGLHKINKNLIYFSNIDYMYNTAKCNICNSNLLFSHPIIYNLMAHLFLIHKKNFITSSDLDIACDKNNKKILDLLKNDNEGAYKAKPVSKPRRKSPVWKYFINNTDCRATCKICHFNFSYKGGAVNNLGRHLRLRHNVHIPTRNGEGDVNNFENYDEADLSELQHFPMLPKKRTYVKLRSKTWNYFSKEPNDWAKCILCKRYLSYRSSTINNLTRHLRTVHADIYSCLFGEKEISGDGGTGNSEITNDDVFKNVLLEATTTRSRDEVLQECWYTASEQSSTKRTSIVWNYFNEVNRDSGRCSFCSKLISCKGGGTSNLSRHLRVKHGIWIVLTSTLAKKYEEQFSIDDKSDQTDFVFNQNSDPSLNPNDKIITHEELHYLKTKKPKSKKSKTWDYFIKETPEKVVCKICSKVLSYKCKAVHNLRRHLSIKHPDCIVNREPVRLKLQIDEKESSSYEGENEPLVTDKKYIDITNTSVVIVDEEVPPPMRKADRCTRPKKSLVWNYFEELEYGVAKCNLCSKVLSFRGGGTNNLMRHLRSQHSIIIDLQVAEDNGFMITSNEGDSAGVAIVLNNDDGNLILGN